MSRNFHLILPLSLLAGVLVLAGLILSGHIPVHIPGSAAMSQPDSEISSESLPFLDPGKIDKSRTRIVIHKSDYELYLYEGDSLLRTYASVFGPEPKGDKFMQGDGRTPEGHFKVRSMYDHAKWTKFIWIDYPNEESWRRFRARKANGEVPDHASIGGDIGIHGVPSGYENLIPDRQNWTLGCISLTTDAIIELYGAVQVGTEIEILP